MQTQPLVERAVTETSPSSTLNFWKVWSATSFSNLGDGLYQIVFPLLAIRLTTSPSLVAGVSLMLNLPWLIFALQAGSIVDRFDRRRVMLWVTCLRVFVLFTLTLSIITNFASIPLLYLAALLMGIGETLVDTALTSIVPSVISKDRLSWANAKISAAQTVTNTFIGPPLAGYLAGMSFALATGSSTFMYAAAALALISMRGNFHVSPDENKQTEKRGWSHITEGVRFLWRDRLIRDLTLFTASMNIFWAGWGALLVLYAVKPGPMGLGEFEYGLLLTTMAVGGLLGSLFCERIEKVLGIRNALVLDFLGTIALVGVPALTTNVFAVGASAFLAGLGASVWVILVSSIRQKIVPANLLGRVYSASRFISWGVGPLGVALAALIAEIWSIRTMFGIGGVISVGLLFLFVKFIPSKTLEKADISPAQ